MNHDEISTYEEGIPFSLAESQRLAEKSADPKTVIHDVVPAYKLTLHTAEIDRTTWWKDENHKAPAGVWWLEGHGLSRPATDVEVALWQQAGARALAVVRPFSDFVNVAQIGGTPEACLRREFGL